MDTHVEAFLHHLSAERGFSANTLAAYRNDLRQFLAFLSTRRDGGSPVANWAQVERTHLLEHVLALKDRQYAPATVARKVAAMKSFFHFLRSEGLIGSDPAEDVDSPKVGKSLPNVLSEAEVEQLLQEPARVDTPEARRDEAMFELLYATGMRVSELVSLNLNDLRLQEGHVRCIGKGNRERMINLHQRAVRTLRSYLRDSRHLLGRARDSQALFLNHRGERLTRQGFWLLLKGYGRRAKIATPLTPHTLRHSVATHLLRGGMPLRQVQELLGHASIATTEVYTHLTQDHLREVYDASHPRAR
ncbi:MAG: site-specific tyrosine recombinase XerD [Chloroflexi bacterium]|nr:site-specific tyrosine recombinase XerD [Chloroflexota bacterium]